MNTGRGMKMVYYRLYRVFFVCARALLPWREPEVIAGKGSVADLSSVVAKMGLKRVLIVAGRTVMNSGALNAMFSGLDTANVGYSVFAGVRPDPDTDTVEEALALYLSAGCEGIIAAGGGSVIDCAKAVAARVAVPGKTVGQLAGYLKIRRKVPPLFAVPTTAGTGSEATIAAVISDPATQRKHAISDLCLIPIVAVLDPELTLTVPPRVTAETGMDALTHAVEAYTNCSCPAYAGTCAAEAVKLIFGNLETVCIDGGDITARAAMLRAAYLAGTAFTRAGVGYVHAIAHAVGALYGMPHGRACALILPGVMDEYGAAVYTRLARLAEAIGIDGCDDGEKARAFIGAIRSLERRIGIEPATDVIRVEDIPKIAEWAAAESNPEYPVPEIWDIAAFASVVARLCR